MSYQQKSFESPAVGLKQSIYTLAPQIQSVLLDPSKKQDTSLWKSRCNQLKSSLIQATSNLELANYKKDKAEELAKKAQEIQLTNSQLIMENENNDRIYQGKMMESQIWKNKYEQSANQMIGIKTEYDTQIKTLKATLDNLKKGMNEENMEKVKQIEEKKSHFTVSGNSQVNQLKASHTNSMQLYEEQISKLSNIVEEREKYISDLQLKLQTQKNSTDLQLNRLCEEREKLRLNMSQLELQLQKEFDVQKKRQTNQINKLIENQDGHHKNQVFVLQSEIANIKNLLGIKNQEIQQVIQQGKKMKELHADDVNALKQEIEKLKLKLFEFNQNKDQEINDLLKKVQAQKKAEMDGAEFLGQNQIQALNDEIGSLTSAVDNKTDEINQQVKEKQLQNENYETDLSRLQNEIDVNKLKILELENRKSKQINDKQVNSQQSIKIINDIIHQQQIQIQHLEQETENLQKLLESKIEEIQRNNDQFNNVKNTKEQDIKNKSYQIQDLNKKFQAEQQEFQFKEQEQLIKIQQFEADQRDSEKEFLSQIEIYQKTLDEKTQKLLQETQLADDNLNLRSLLEMDCKQLQAQIDSMNQNIIDMKRQKVQEYQNMRLQFDEQNVQNIQHLENQHRTQINVMNNKIDELQNALSLKDLEYEKQMEEYSNLQNILTDNNNTQFSNKKYDETIQHMGANILTTKNVFDVKIQNYK